ncbi:MAG: hypothetical protein ABWY08_14255 [Comamonas sp.]
MATETRAAAVHVLGACHSGADALRADLALALPFYDVRDASPEWLAARPCALPAQGRHCWLLCGLDLDCPASQQAQQQREDAFLREQLMRSGVVFRVVYGATAPQRLSQALQAIDAVAPCAVTALHRASEASQRLRPMCEQCSDPECERKLFSRLGN